ncbi:MAG: hypothetical protein GY859_18075, partial [Desulfobacterales bacterium]|nr:hypothetical protein [Desulfobacterales bacterium]
MKILIGGKGGSGKSTLAALTARGLRELGLKVLLVDADESNLGLHGLLGAPPPGIMLESLGGKKGLKEKLKPMFPAAPGENIIKPGTRIDELPGEWISETDGVKMLVIGKIVQFGEGCACPLGVLFKTVFSRLDVREDEVVVIDAAAGVEHFGRRLDGECDLILGVVDPSRESFLLAGRMEEMARAAGVDIHFVLNKVEPRVEAVMDDYAPRGKVLAKIPRDETIFMNSLKGEALPPAAPEIDQLCRKLMKDKPEDYFQQAAALKVLVSMQKAKAFNDILAALVSPSEILRDEAVKLGVGISDSGSAGKWKKALKKARPEQ